MKIDEKDHVLGLWLLSTPGIRESMMLCWRRRNRLESEKGRRFVVEVRFYDPRTNNLQGTQGFAMKLVNDPESARILVGKMVMANVQKGFGKFFEMIWVDAGPDKMMELIEPHREKFKILGIFSKEATTGETPSRSSPLILPGNYQEQEMTSGG